MRILLFLVIATFVFSTCQNKSVEKVSQTKDQLEIMTDTALVFDTLSNVDLRSILCQIKINQSDCYTEFISHCTFLHNRKLTVWVIPKIANLQKDNYGNQSFDLDGYLLLADTQTGKIVSRNYRPSLWMSDAYHLTNISIDTTYANLNNNNIIFGVVSSYKASTSVNPTGNSDVELFMQQGDSLRMILNYSRSNYHGENDGGYKGNGFMGDTSTELFRTKRRTNGLSDIVLVTSSTYNEWENNESVSNSFDVDSIRAFQYTGVRYKNVPLNSNLETICKETNEGGIGDRTCYYMGKSLSEVYQTVYNKNQDNLKKWMLAQLPTKDTEYKKINDYDDEVSVQYTVKNDSLINVSFDFELSGLNYSFEQKNGFVVVVYSYHD